MSEKGPKPDPKLGLCLAGGGGLGFLHAGLFEALEDLGICPGVVAGTSSGAVLGAFYASGKSAREAREAAIQFRWSEIFAPSILRRGLNSTKGLQKTYKEQFGDIDVSDLPIRLKIAALNLFDGTLVGFTEGPLAKCLAASSAVPGLFEPVRIRGGVYYDAGGIYNLPLELFAGENVDRIIAGNTIGQFGLQKRPGRVRDVLYQAYLVRTMHLTAMRTGEAGWQGKGNEELILIDYRTEGVSSSRMKDRETMLDRVKKQSLEILQNFF